ncbi:MAG TPA: CHASE2 domain-containing protein [Noviherbaspirillum sp.]|nr:CHASE2 domain-containing protein [Noviherbaspirillum sp.]
MPHAEPSHRSSLETEWRVFAILMLCIAGLLGYLVNPGSSANMAYDMLMRATPQRQMDDIVIVAIDDSSIDTIGRWPWPRRTHARLLDILTEGGVRAVGLDILLLEPGRRQDELNDDALLAAALAKNGRTVLPVVLEHGTSHSRAALPLPALALAAAGLGHTHFEFDHDALLRRVHLTEEVPNGIYAQFALAIHEVGLVGPSGVNPSEVTSHGAGERLARTHVMNIPFAGPPGQFRTVSYRDVLSGRIAPAFFADKYVLVGATAAGLATIVPTPVTAGHKGMTGVEANANVLAALIGGTRISDATGWQTGLFGLIATLLSLFACRYLSPRRALLATLMLGAAVLFITFVAFRSGVWLPPATAMLMVLIVYPLWSWRRLEAALAFLNEEFSQLNRSTNIASGSDARRVSSGDTDFFDRRIAEMRIAADRARGLQRFLADSLDSMPDAAFILSPQGDVLMYNRVARLYLDIPSEAPASAISLETAFTRISMTGSNHGRPAGWTETLLSTRDGGMVEIEARDTEGKEFLVKSTASKGANGHTLGWIVSLVDVTTLRDAERQRDQTLHFISHDMRAPQSSILALLELQRNPRTAFSPEDFHARVEKLVLSTLSLADDFVHLAKARSATYHLQDADIHSMLADAADDMWALARGRRIKVTIDVQAGGDWVYVDRPLMVRAIGNLLSNAIKFSPSGSEVRCIAHTVGYANRNYIHCSIEDDGDGIPESMRGRIFMPFPQRQKSGRDGVGLGLAFVKMVVERHGGSISFENRAGGGCTFTLVLPCVTDSLIVSGLRQDLAV